MYVDKLTKAMNYSDLSFESQEAGRVSDLYRRAASHLPLPVAVVAASDPDDGPFGFTVSSLTAVSETPPLLSFCIAGSGRARDLARLRFFTVNLLPAQGANLATLFAAPGADRFREVDWTPGTLGAPELESAVAIFRCTFLREIEAGDHRIVLGEVSGARLGTGEPLVYWRRAFHRLRLDYPFVANPAALERFVAAWEAGELAHSDWTHGAHVAIAACYAYDHPPETAFRRTRDGIRHFNECCGTPNTDHSGYHETLTRLWAGLIGEFVRSRSFSSRYEAARAAVERFGEDRDRHRLYYSFDVVRDTRARREWVPPDREGC